MNSVYVHVPKEFSMWNNIQRLQLRLGSRNWLYRGWGEKIRKQNSFFESHLGHFLFVSVNEPCVHVPKEFSMWNNIQRSQLRLGSWNWLDFRWGEKIRKRYTFLKATLVVWNTKCYLNTESKFCNRGFVTLYVNNEIPKALVLKTLIPNADSIRVLLRFMRNLNI